MEKDNSCYYINGKPGSGKSTLIKFIAQHERTGASFAKRAGTNLVKAFFFF
jgi:ribosome biogenesis GTPase A